MTLSRIEIQQKIGELEVKLNEVEDTNKILTRQIKEFYLLYDVCKNLNQTKTHKEVFSVLTSILKKDFNVQEFSVFIYNPKLKILNIEFSTGLPKKNIKEFFYRSNEGFVGKVFNSCKSLYLHDLKEYKNFNYYQMIKKITGSVFYLPLQVSQEETLGVLKLRKTRPNSFSKFEQNILKQIGEPLSIALKKGLEFDTLDRIAWIDTLTGFHTKKYFEKSFNAEIRRSQRYQHSLSLINFTIDNLSEIVHEYGKESGDLIVKEIAIFLQENMRMCDICFRYAPNQFLILLPETQKSDAKEVVGKINQNWGNKEILLRDEYLISLEISSGFANYPKDTIEPPILLQIALESAKKF
jgi:diguanylate cyclase (GGDEF)-like protein